MHRVRASQLKECAIGKGRKDGVLRQQVHHDCVTNTGQQQLPLSGLKVERHEH